MHYQVKMYVQRKQLKKKKKKQEIRNIWIKSRENKL